MSAKAFIDTNIVVYQFDQSAPRKRNQARQLIKHYLASGQACISTQVVQEFLHVALRKFERPMSHEELSQVIADILQPLCTHAPSIDFYSRALALHKAHSLSFYDALIVQAAIDSGCTLLLSEDLQAGQRFGSLIVVNPFAVAP